MSRVALLGLALAATTGCEGRKPPPKLEVSARWGELDARPGCKRHPLVFDIATIAFGEVKALGVAAHADADGKATLEVRRAVIGHRRTIDVEVAGAKDSRVEVAVPPRTADASPVLLGEAMAGPGQVAAPDGVVIWTGDATGAMVNGTLRNAWGVLDGHDLRLRFAGCDLKGGTAPGGSVAPRGTDDIEVRFALVARLAAATTLAPMTAPLTFEVENADGATGQVTLTGRLDVAGALAAMQRAAIGAKVADAPAWQAAGGNPILVVGPGLGETADAIERADKLLRGAPIGRAAAVLSLDITQVASDRVCGRAGDVDHSLPSATPTTTARIEARLLSRSTGEAIALQVFENVAECPTSITSVDRQAATIAAGPPWDAILDWLERLPGR